MTDSDSSADYKDVKVKYRVPNGRQRRSGQRSPKKVVVKQRERKRKRAPVTSPRSDDTNSSPRENGEAVGNELGNIPIFTREFLMHNKQREVLLKTLKKEVTDVEDERRNLIKHYDSLESEMETQRNELRKFRDLNIKLERAHQSIIEQVAEALQTGADELSDGVDLSSKAGRLSAARKYIKLCASQGKGVQLAVSDLEFVQNLRRTLGELVVTI